MPTIHIDGDGHVTPATLGDGTTWSPYTDAKIKKCLEDALHIIKTNVRNMRPCDECFKRLPGLRTFTEVFDDATVFISFDSAGPDRAAAIVSGHDITLSAGEFKRNKWAVAASIIHELAHINGAPGGNSPSAENTLLCCGFKGHFTGVLGSNEKKSSSRSA